MSELRAQARFAIGIPSVPTCREAITVLLAFLIGCAASHTDDANADADWACWTLAFYDCH
jgi:hypothetical protein